MMELTKKDTKMIQGLCVLAMVWLHLFDTWNYEGIFKPLVFIYGFPLTLYIAQLSDFCVMGFAFCSGYAQYLLSEKEEYYKKRLRSLLKLFVKYWTVLFSFTAISIFIGRRNYMPGSWKTFLLSFLFLDSGYNGAWWYLFSYIVIVLISPFLLRRLKKEPFWLILICYVLIYCLSYYFRIHVQPQGVVLSKLGPLGMTLVEYIMGATAAKYRYFSIVSGISKKASKPVYVIFSIILVIVMLLARTLIIPSLFFCTFDGNGYNNSFPIMEETGNYRRCVLIGW